MPDLFLPESSIKEEPEEVKEAPEDDEDVSEILEQFDSQPFDPDSIHFGIASDQDDGDSDFNYDDAFKPVDSFDEDDSKQEILTDTNPVKRKRGRPKKIKVEGEEKIKRENVKIERGTKNDNPNRPSKYCINIYSNVRFL